MQEIFLGLVDLEWGRAEFLLSADFDSLVLNSSGLDSLLVVFWVYTFEVVLLEKR